MSSNAIVPRTIDDVARLAKMAHASGLAKVSSPEAAGVIILAGMELGLTPMQALMGMHMVEGRPTLAADTLVALVMRRTEICEVWEVLESTVERCTITAKRVDRKPVTRTWSMDDARRAGLASKAIWQKYPADMLRHRCCTALGRQVFPDIVLGYYDREELDEEPSPGFYSQREPVATVAALPAAPAAPAQLDPPRARPAIAAAPVADAVPVAPQVPAAPVPQNDAEPVDPLDAVRAREAQEVVNHELFTDARTKLEAAKDLPAIVETWRGLAEKVRAMPTELKTGLFGVARDCAGRTYRMDPQSADAWLRAALKVPAGEPTPSPIRTSKKEVLPTPEAMVAHFKGLKSRKHLENAARAHGLNPWARAALIDRGVDILETDRSDVAQTVDAWAAAGPVKDTAEAAA